MLQAHLTSTLSAALQAADLRRASVHIPVPRLTGHKRSFDRMAQRSEQAVFESLYSTVPADEDGTLAWMDTEHSNVRADDILHALEVHT